jgi:hypothetical protein
MHCAECPSLASHNSAVLMQHVGTALSGTSFFCLLVSLVHESWTYWWYWVWSRRVLQQPTGHHDSHLPLRQLWRAIPSVVFVSVSCLSVVENLCVVAPKWSVYCQFLIWNGNGLVCSSSVFPGTMLVCIYCCMYVHVYVHTCVCTCMCTYFSQTTSDILTDLNGKLLCATNAMALGLLGVPVFCSLYYSHRPVVLYVCFSSWLAPAKSGNRDM